jgi:hypothetical protein
MQTSIQASQATTATKDNQRQYSIQTEKQLQGNKMTFLIHNEKKEPSETPIMISQISQIPHMLWSKI